MNKYSQFSILFLALAVVFHMNLIPFAVTIPTGQVEEITVQKLEDDTCLLTVLSSDFSETAFHTCTLPSFSTSKGGVYWNTLNPQDSFEIVLVDDLDIYRSRIIIKQEPVSPDQNLNYDEQGWKIGATGELIFKQYYELDQESRNYYPSKQPLTNSLNENNYDPSTGIIQGFTRTINTPEPQCKLFSYGNPAIYGQTCAENFVSYTHTTGGQRLGTDRWDKAFIEESQGIISFSVGRGGSIQGFTVDKSKIDASPDYRREIERLRLTIEEMADYINQLQTSITESAEIIASLQLEAEQQAQIINGLRLTINEKTELIERLNQNIEDQIRVINNLQATISEKAVMIENLQSEITNQAEIIAGLELTRQEQAEMINELGLTIDQQEIIIQNLNLNLQEKIRLIEMLNIENEEQQELIDRMWDSFGEQANIIRALNQTIQQDAQLIASYELTISNQAELIRNLNYTIQEQAQLIIDLRMSNEQMGQTINELNLTIKQQADLINELRLSNKDMADIIEELDLKTKEQAELIEELDLSNRRMRDLVEELDLSLQEKIRLIELLSQKNKELQDILNRLLDQACNSDSDCPTGLVCEQMECVLSGTQELYYECSGDGNCNLWEKCDRGNCIPDSDKIASGSLILGVLLGLYAGRKR